MGFIVGLIIGIVVGIIIKTAINRVSSIGSIYIYKGDLDEKPYMFLALSANLETFIKKKFIVLKLEQKDTHPQK